MDFFPSSTYEHIQDPASYAQHSSHPPQLSHLQSSSMSLQLPGVRTATSSPPIWSDTRASHSLTSSSSPPMSSSARASSPFAAPPSSSSSVASYSAHTLAAPQPNSNLATIPSLSPFDPSILPPPQPQHLPKREHGDYRLQLWVGNLPFRVRWQDLKDLFRKCGTVLRADVALTPDNRSRGFGTVLFAHETDAHKALEMFNGYSWQTRTLDVRIDSQDPTGALNLLQQNPANQLAPSQQTNAQAHHTFPHGFLTRPHSAAGHENLSGRSPSPANLQHASILGAAAYPHSSSPMNGSQYLQRNPAMPYSSGNSILPTSSPMMNTATNNRVLFVGNLPFNCQWQELKDLFRQAGNVLRADVTLGPDGRSRGFGTVVYATLEDAQAAVRLFNGYEFNGRQLKVHFDKFAHPPQTHASQSQQAHPPIPGMPQPPPLGQNIPPGGLANVSVGTPQFHHSHMISNAAAIAAATGHSPNLAAVGGNGGYFPANNASPNYFPAPEEYISAEQAAAVDAQQQQLTSSDPTSIMSMEQIPGASSSRDSDSSLKFESAERDQQQSSSSSSSTSQPQQQQQQSSSRRSSRTPGSIGPLPSASLFKPFTQSGQMTPRASIPPGRIPIPMTPGVPVTPGGVRVPQPPVGSHSSHQPPHHITIPTSPPFGSVMSPYHGRQVPMTPSMPGFSFQPIAQTPPLMPQFLSPGLGLFSPPISGFTSPGHPYPVNAAPGAPVGPSDPSVGAYFAFSPIHEYPSALYEPPISSAVHHHYAAGVSQENGEQQQYHHHYQQQQQHFNSENQTSEAQPQSNANGEGDSVGSEGEKSGHQENNPLLPAFGQMSLGSGGAGSASTPSNAADSYFPPVTALLGSKGGGNLSPSSRTETSDNDGGSAGDNLTPVTNDHPDISPSSAVSAEDAKSDIVFASRVTSSASSSSANVHLQQNQQSKLLGPRGGDVDGGKVDPRRASFESASITTRPVSSLSDRPLSYV